jgi:transaldolase
MNKINNLKVKIFADGANKRDMIEMNSKSFIKGLTTNPTLMKKEGITDYREFCRDILLTIKKKPISFEVFSDDFIEMEKQAVEISSWGNNVYVKIPITNTKQEPCYEVVEKLSKLGIKLNITAIMTLSQVKKIVSFLQPNVPNYISVFAGRIADTGVDPEPLMAEAVEILKLVPASELIWASPRELYNIFQADRIGCHIITATNDILKKLNLIDYDLEKYSLDTVKMFYSDAVDAGFKL